MSERTNRLKKIFQQGVLRVGMADTGDFRTSLERRNLKEKLKYVIPD